MKLLLVFNPGASRGQAAGKLDVIRDELQRAGIEATIATTEAPGHATSLVREASSDEFDAVAAAGGDGTLHESVNGLMARPSSRRPPLGLIPLGTGNAFSRDIGLAPDRWREGIRVIAGGYTREVDVGLLESSSEQFHFINIAGVGFVTSAGRTSARLKFIGTAAYTLGALWHCLRLHNHQLSLRVDDREIRQDSLLAEISNSRYTGTSFLIAPGALIDDGLLDLVMVRSLSRLRLLQLFPTIYSGRHVELDEVSVVQGQDISIDAPAGLDFMVDGEFRGKTPARIRCLPRAIRMFAPRQDEN